MKKSVSVQFRARKNSTGYLEQFPVVFLLRVGIHRHGLVDRLCDLLGVPRVDHDASVQTLSCASKLGQDHHALTILLTSDILVRDLTDLGKLLVDKGYRRSTHQVHTIPSAANQANIADGVKSTELIKCQTLVHEVDRHEFDGSETPIDTSNQLVNGRPQILVLFDVLP